MADVYSEMRVDLRADDQQTKDLKRIADRVRKIQIRDFTKPISVLIVAGIEDEPIVLIGEKIEEEEIQPDDAIIEVEEY